MSNTDNLAKDESLCNSCIHSRICRFEVPVGEPCEHYIKGSFMTNFDEIKKRIASMNADELIEFCGGDTCENVLCSFVSEGDCCGNNYKVSYDCGNCIKKFLQRETKGYFMTSDRVITNPFLSGACDECINHCKQMDGNEVKHVCCANIIGVLTRNCKKIPKCDKYHRSYKVGGVNGNI